MPENCIFCKIIKGEIPCQKIYENDKVLAFLDINPSNKGHTLIIPKEHSQTFLDINEHVACEIGKSARLVANAIVEATECEGFSLLMNNGKIAGQEVMHAHLHIMPRYNNDDFKFKWTTKKYDDNEIEEYKKKIVALLKE